MQNPVRCICKKPKDFGAHCMIYFTYRAERATELAVASLPLKAKTCTFRSCVNPSQHAAASYPLRARYCMKEFRQDRALFDLFLREQADESERL